MTVPVHDDQPEEGELWVLYHTSVDDEMETKENTRFALAECLGVTQETPDDLPDIDVIKENLGDTPFKARYLYCPHHDFEGEVAHVVKGWHFYARLPEEAEDVDEEYRELLDYHIRTIGYGDTADLLAGETHLSGGREGYEALRLAALEGFSDSITEYSVGHGHGASRYARAVENRLDDWFPDCLIEAALESERHRWDGAMEQTPDTAAKLVEVFMLMEDYLDRDFDEDIRYYVNEYDLEYDEYRDDNGEVEA